jgi:uncharacterized membrane protein YphA (DoxX/SURF4 family)
VKTIANQEDPRAAAMVWTTLRFTFGIVPIVAGLDKFSNLLVDWTKYLAPPIAQVVPAHGFMVVVGLIEIVAGAAVLFSPWTKIFAAVVGLWLLGIAVDLVIAGYYDIAVRDAVMAVSAFCLSRLSASRAQLAPSTAPGNR